MTPMDTTDTDDRLAFLDEKVNALCERITALEEFRGEFEEGEVSVDEPVTQPAPAPRSHHRRIEIDGCGVLLAFFGLAVVIHAVAALVTAMK